jgi:putative DNA modification/repair radical SAM protein
MFDSLLSKLNILAEGAKYDVSCSSSGSSRKQVSGGLGNAKMCGICHSFTSDGRCISLLKTLMSNDCSFDCLYCGCKRSNDIERASFTPKEICELTVNFYKRNYIEGLFLSSAVEKNPEYTMQKLVDTVVMLRKEYNFNGYIHLKGIPSAPYELILKGAAYADRMSFNIELPSQQSLKLLAPQKNKDGIVRPMQNLAQIYIGQGRKKSLIPAGQTTQMIIGASPESDGQIIRLSQALYNNYMLKRVYYSSYIPVNTDNSLLPQQKSKLIREHRLYQADWLLRFYGFSAQELISQEENFSEEFDPKCWWAMKNFHLFPVEINKAPLEMLLRVPGIGAVSAYKIVNARKFAALDFDDLKKMRVTLKRAKHFITCKGKFIGVNNSETAVKCALLYGGESAKQLSVFDSDTALSVINGQL